jgi:hypothetical protein
MPVESYSRHYPQRSQGHVARRPRKSTAREWVLRRRGTGSDAPFSFIWSVAPQPGPHGGRKSGDPMSHTRPDPAPKPDHIRSLRDLAANFVRAIDRTALEFEAVATTELTERVACLVTLHEIETTNAELTKTPTKLLRERLNLLRQVGRAEQEVDYSTRQSTNGELRKRIEYLRQADRASYGAMSATTPFARKRHGTALTNHVALSRAREAHGET